MLLTLAFTLSMGLSASQAPAPPAIPAGLWFSREDTLVVRVEPCGEGFCGVAVGTARDEKDKAKPEASCGKTIMKDFKWDAKDKRWEGRMQRPSTPNIGASVTSDGRTFLTMTGRFMMMSKTISFIPFTGTIGANCLVE